ncbi:hypothetical protein [Poseidonibacter lekithochrous]|uniref:hypothetical protein n=1 Tax=Poseidonibacter lekithochrous TaxID=1904463 RepID=UPI000D33AC73|nr:hypothetical protein [Poseidonibacter lekithochrous]
MNKQVKTTLLHIPLLVFQYYAILSCTQKNIEYSNINYLEPLGLLILIPMIIITIYMTYRLKSIHKYTRELYLFVLLFTPTSVGFLDNHIVSSLIPFLTYSISFFYIDNIKNDDFSENDNKKEIAPRVYNQFLDNTLDEGFEKFDCKKELILFDDIKNCEILEINKLNEEIGIVYMKNNTKKFLKIEPIYHMSSINGITTFFKIDSKPLDQIITNTLYSEEEKKMVDQDFIKTSHDILTGIKQIVNIFHLSNKHDIHNRNDILEIIYKDNKNLTNSYRLHFTNNENEDIKLDIKKYEDIFSFKTRVLEDKDKTQLLYSYDQKYFCPKMEYNYLEEVYDESKDCENLSPQIRRKAICSYDYDFPLTTFGRKIRFVLDDKEGIKAYNISHSHLLNPLFLPSKEIYAYLNEKEKKKLHHFLAIAQMYLNDLYVNREFDNQFVIDTFENEDDDWRFDKLEEILENSNWIKKRYYDNAEQGHSASMLVDIYYKENNEDKKFVLFNENDWLSFKISVKYNDDVKSEVEELLKDIM